MSTAERGGPTRRAMIGRAGAGAASPVLAPGLVGAGPRPRPPVPGARPVFAENGFEAGVFAEDGFEAGVFAEHAASEAGP